MVTYSDLFQFGILIVGIISLVIQVNNNKNPPAQPGVFHRRVQPFDTSLHVTSCEYDLPAAKVLLLATR